MYNYLAARGYLTSIGIDTLGQSDESFVNMCNAFLDALRSQPEAKPRKQAEPLADHVMIYTDGACSGNPGPGGWGTVLMYQNHRTELSGAEPDTTNNRMELMAAIKGLSALKRPCKVMLYSDSAYLVRAFNEGWLLKWQKNGWKNAQNKEVENRDLWEILRELTGKHTVTFVKVKGHADNEHNNRCDELAVAAYRAIKEPETEDAK